ncbi:hypothetical protein BH10CHL1_BH10CHL1_27330 [soil metagenome]
MEALLAWFLLKLSFFASGLGLLTIGAIAVSIILFWNWRQALAGVLLVQIGVAVLIVYVHGVAQDWAAVQILVMGLCLVILALSAQQVRPALHMGWSGSWLLRSITVLLLLASWQVFHLKLTLPLISPQIVQLFIWLGLCTLIVLSLSDTPFFTGIALLLWCVPVQAIIQILLPASMLFVLIDIVQIILALACSYLILTAYAPLLEEQPVLTDLTFPTDEVVIPIWADNGMNGATGLLNNGQPRKALPPERTTEYPFAVGGPQ